MTPEVWLYHKVASQEESVETRTAGLEIPTHSGGKSYTADGLYEDQQDILNVVLDALDTWLKCKTKEDFDNFEPLRLTVSGPGGSGKSVLINTIVTIIRKMFQSNDAVKILAPTGCAAANVGGETVHHCIRTGINDDTYKANTMREEKKKKLMDSFHNLVALIIDERSLLGSKLLGTLCQSVTETTYSGYLKHKDWGGVPIVILVGDDYQLPPVAGSGAFKSHWASSCPMTMKGHYQFRECSKKAMFLQTSRRVLDKDVETKRINENYRVAQPNESDVEKLMSLNLSNFSEEHIQMVESKSVYLTTRNAEVDRKNLQKLCDMATEQRPVAIIRTSSDGKGHGNKGIQRHFGDSDTMFKSSIICESAVVSIRGRNFYPAWGLFNGATGYVNEIVYNKGESPSQNQLPRYIVVDFPNYTGPPWDLENPTHVPIPMVDTSCKHKCCSRTFCPIELSYARTIWKFQGLSAGPTDKMSNMYQCVICDPGDKGTEGKNPGLLYTAISRATTLGGRDGLDSALYFLGNNANEERFRNLLMKENRNELYSLITHRLNWTTRLSQNRFEPTFTQTRKEELLNLSKMEMGLPYLFGHIGVYTDPSRKRQRPH